MMESIEQLRQFEGRQVCVALADGSRLEHCSLVSVGRGPAKTVWVFAEGIDVFLRLPEVVAIWEAAPDRGLSAA